MSGSKIFRRLGLLLAAAAVCPVALAAPPPAPSPSPSTAIVPRGFNGTWVLSAHYRHLIILEPKQLQAGMAQFE